MFCRNCGFELPDGAKFCIECGAPTPKYEQIFRKDDPIGGDLVFTWKGNPSNNSIPVHIWINGRCNHIIHEGETITIHLPADEYAVVLKQNDKNLNYREVIVVDGESESIVFSVTPIQSSTTAITRNKPTPVPVDNSVLPRNFGRICPKCGGIMTTQVVSEDRKSGCGTILLYVLLALTIFGLLIVIPLALRKKTETVTYAVCTRCGHKIVLSRH